MSPFTAEELKKRSAARKRRWRAAHPDWRTRISPEVRQRAHQKMRARGREYLRAYLASHPCARCGVADVECLVFQYRVPEPTQQPVRIMAKNGVALERLRQAISRCDVLCLNCRRKQRED